MDIKRRWIICFSLILVGAFVPAEEKVHVLRNGETLYSLARRYRVELQALLEFNDIADPTELPVGARIRIPSTYVVQSGEYVFSIARKLGVDWRELLGANGLSEQDVLRPGDTLIVPETARVTRVAPEENAEAPVAGERTATPNSQPDLLWPHPGRRASWDGRFPGTVMEGTEGDEIRSVTRGVVSFAGPFTSFGKIILVKGDAGYLYGYAGAEEVLVQPGDRVDVGTVIGRVGFSPAFEAVRVLFTVWHRNRYVDPESAPRG